MLVVHTLCHLLVVSCGNRELSHGFVNGSTNREKLVRVSYGRRRVRGVGGFIICLKYLIYSHHSNLAFGMDGFWLAGNHLIVVVIITLKVTLLK